MRLRARPQPQPLQLVRAPYCPPLLLHCSTYYEHLPRGGVPDAAQAIVRARDLVRVRVRVRVGVRARRVRVRIRIWVRVRVTSSVPSQLKSTPETGSECAGRILRHLPVFTSHNRSDSSKEPEASRFPCGLKLTQKTKFACPRSVLSILPEATLHT